MSGGRQVVGFRDDYRTRATSVENRTRGRGKGDGTSFVRRLLSIPSCSTRHYRGNNRRTTRRRIRSVFFVKNSFSHRVLGTVPVGEFTNVRLVSDGLLTSPRDGSVGGDSRVVRVVFVVDWGAHRPMGGEAVGGCFRLVRQQVRRRCYYYNNYYYNRRVIERLAV